jgi:hypothetical protein
MDMGYERRDEGLGQQIVPACVLASKFSGQDWQIFQHGSVVFLPVLMEYESDGKYAMTWIDEDA